MWRTSRTPASATAVHCYLPTTPHISLYLPIPRARPPRPPPCAARPSSTRPPGVRVRVGVRVRARVRVSVRRPSSTPPPGAAMVLRCTVVPACTVWHTRVVPRCTARPRRARTYCAPAAARTVHRPEAEPARGTAQATWPACRQWWQQRAKLPRAPAVRTALQRAKGLRLSTCGCRRCLDAEVLVVHHDVTASRRRGRVARAAPRAREPRRQRTTCAGRARRGCVPRRVRVPRQQAGGEHETGCKHFPTDRRFRCVARSWRGRGYRKTRDSKSVLIYQQANQRQRNLVLQAPTPRRRNPRPR